VGADKTWSRRFGKQRVSALRSVLDVVATGKVIDLGAGHGIFSRMADEAGWDVVALDARRTRFPADLDGRVEFREASVDSDAWHGSEFDLILCCGLFYHLDLRMQDRLLERCAGTPLFLDTHYADKRPWAEWADQTGPPVVEDGLPGVWFGEAPAADEAERKANRLTASFENQDSFWATEAGLREHLRRHGYTTTWTWHHDNDPAQRVVLLALP
jgi:hypothetical protein